MAMTCLTMALPTCGERIADERRTTHGSPRAHHRRREALRPWNI
jgi:hypothetical protein